ncbi:5-formyltetrahydrofolate cyclo-ligase-like isoform X2 [Eriocheir sinensis]|uniref:5-formyltetrahydrofolate cyclo-ligase-like isoform X2 n=1 Tax=Eriocheir sinensis TaxID=95602 RepID=UPI0021C7FBEC|nr:5-formyltetrahydrofolate cyclo-ligase-like isoform X2 [Eriocheir sinensis]
MTDLKSAKAALRKVLNEKLNALTSEEVERQSKEVEKKVLAHPKYKDSKRLAIYLCMPKEIQTTGILRHALESGKTCYIPRYQTKSNYMDMVRLHSWEEYDALPVTRWNIKQPPMSQSCETALASGGLDLILMPGLGFTREGHRMGRGKGYYDTFLAKCKASQTPPPSTIALAFKEQVLPEIPTDETDIMIDIVMTAE